MAWSGLSQPSTFPGLAAIAAAGWGLLGSADFLLHLSTTSLRAVTGLTIAIVIGLSMAIVAGRYPHCAVCWDRSSACCGCCRRRRSCQSRSSCSASARNCSCSSSAFASLWPIYINAANALAAAEPVQMMTARCFGYSDWETLLRLRLPAALPDIMTGIRIGAGVALLATIAAEMLAGQSGLGFLLYDAAFSLRTADMFAIMAMIGLLGLLFNALVQQASRLVVGWHLEMTALAEPA